jgi:hypothetical protein
MSTDSPALKRCSSKQKHWILLKYRPARMGVTLYVATPTTGSVMMTVFVRIMAVM